MSFKSLLIHNCEIAAPVTARDGGELEVTYPNSITVRCRYVPQTEHWSQESNSRIVTREHMLMLETGATIDRRYQVSNITLRYDDSVVDAGPFVVTEVLNMGGRLELHHIEATMERAG